ncbi:HDIG domain-containing protein [bacterium]|nr:HDIG domain-containing protein [bacterium]
MPLKQNSKADPAIRKQRLILLRLFIGVATVAILSVISFPAKTLFQGYDLAIGEIANDEIISPIKFPVLKTEAELEEELGEKLLSVRPIYRYDDTDLNDRWREFRRLMGDHTVTFSTATTEETEAYDYFDKLTDSLEGRYRQRISPALLRKLKRTAELFETVKSLPSSLRGTVADGVLEDITRLGQGEFDGRIINLLPAELETLVDLSVVKEEISLLVGPYFSDPELTAELVELVGGYLRPTLFLDEEATRQRISEVERGIPRESYWVSENERIVTAHEVITPAILRRLEALDSFRASPGILYVTLGRAAIIIVFIFIFGLFLRQYRRRYYDSPRHLLLLAMILISVVGLAQLLVTTLFQSLPAIGYLLPAALAGMLMTILLDTETGLVGALVAAVTLGLLTGLEVRYLFVFLTGGLAAVFASTSMRHRSSLYRIAFQVILAKGLIIAAIGLSFSDPLAETLNHILIGSVGAILSVFIGSLVLPIFEALFHITTPVQLLELTDLNHLLLRRLARKAPGTYYHSLNVGILAEAAAGAIGADGLVARVGSYYHDIGKITKAEYYTENISGESPHDKLTPSMSSLIIRNHVRDGLTLARKHRLPTPILSAIAEHHGRGLIGFFYQRALREDEHNILEKDTFRYAGPLPQTKESAIIMLADSVEGASRSLHNTSISAIRLLVRKIINTKFVDGQLAECDLTISDLTNIVESFVQTLSGLLHSRIEYPEEENPRKLKTNGNGISNGNGKKGS